MRIFRKNFYPILLSDEKSLYKSLGSVGELGSFVPSDSICSNDTLVDKLKTISLLSIDLKSDHNFSFLNKNNLTELFQLFLDLNFFMFHVRF